MMRLEPEERRNYVHSQLDEYGRIYMSCLELFVYKLWSRQRLLLKNNKIYEEKLMTISEVIGTLTQSDQIVDANKNESDKLESVIQKIHRIVFIPPNKEADLHMVNELLVKEAEEGFSDLNISQLLLQQQHHIQPSNITTTTTTTTGTSSRQHHHQVIKQHSSSSSTREATTSRESNSSSLKSVNGTSTNTNTTNSSKKSRRESEIKNNGHCPVPNVVSPLSMSIEAPPKRNSVTINDATTTITSSATNGKGGDKESDSGLTNRRSLGKRANGSNGGGGNGVPKKSRNNRTKDDKEIVKCCAQKGCEYIERDNANNMRKHYRNWHDDIEYPPAPYVKREMGTEMVNQYLHNWMIQRKKRQPPKSRDRPSNDSWQGLPIEGMLVYHDDTGNQEDEDYEVEVNEQLIASFIKSEKQEANSSP